MFASPASPGPAALPCPAADGEAAPGDLFDTLSEADYLPLAGAHDSALLDSLVARGCEDNSLGQALAHLAAAAAAPAPAADAVAPAAGEYDDEEDMLLGGAPVADIISRLEHELESPRRSMSAAQGLLTLHRQEPPLYAPDCFPDLETDDEPPTDAFNLPDRRPEPSPPPATVPSEPPVEDVSDTSEVLPKQDEKCVEECADSVVAEVATIDFEKELEASVEDVAPTDLSIKVTENVAESSVGIAELVESVVDASQMSSMEDNMSEKSDEQPRDLSVHRRLPTPVASPRRLLEIPRAPSRESDAMQSPQPSGIPAVPSSPELFTVPKSKQTLFLETLLSSPSPKMYTSEVTISKQQCEPLNLGKYRKSASPTVSSCSDEIRKLNKDFGEPQEKRIRRESTEELAKISKVFSKSSDDHSDAKKPERPKQDENSALKQLQALKLSPDFNIPDPLLVPKNKLNNILANPGREIPALLIQRPELRLPEAFAYPAILQDPDILVISISQLEKIIENDAKIKCAEAKAAKPVSAKSTEQKEASKPDQTSSSGQSKAAPSMDGLAGDIDAATSAALNQMLWLPYLSQLEAAMACSQNMDFLKALNSSGYGGGNYAELSQMFNHPSRFMSPGGFPMMPQMDYENRLQFAMWQEAMNQANARAKPPSQAEHMKDLAKSTDVQNPYVHSTKNHPSKSHSSARTSPIAHNYNSSCQRGPMTHNPFLQGMYPSMNPNVRPNMPLPGLQIPYFNPSMMGSQRSPRTPQQKSPTSPYYQNNNYLQSVKHAEGGSSQRSSSTSSQESPRPRISVRSLQNLLAEPAAVAASGSRRHSSSSSIPSMPSMVRRREETEVGSTTPLGEIPPQMPPMPHPHDPIHHLWHPLFGNQKGYSSPWSWTTVTATGD